MRNRILLSSVAVATLLVFPAFVGAQAQKPPAPEAARVSPADAAPSAPEGGFSCPNGGPVLLDQPPNQSNGIFADADCALCASGQQSIADDFILAAPATVAQIVFWGGYFPGNLIPMPADPFTVIFHQEAANLPGVAIDTQNLVPTSATLTGVVLFGVSEVMYVLDITPVALPAGTFWVEIFANSVGNADQLFWEVGDLDPVNGRLNNAFAQAAPGVTWLTGNPVSDNALVLCALGGPILSITDVQTADGCASDPNNENGVFEPGETITVDVEVSAAGGSFTGISGTLSSLTPGVTVLNGMSTYPDLMDGESSFGDTPFTVQLDEGIACFGQVDLDVTITSNEGAPVMTTISEMVGTPLAPVVPVAIPDNNAAGTTSTVMVGDDVILADVDVRVEITHTWVGDVFVSLRSPANTEVVLLDQPGVPATMFGCADDNMNVTFDDASGFDPENHCAATNPWLVGPANPVGSLSDFNGESSAGTWTLFVSDNALGDLGTIVDWELITNPVIGGVCNVCVGAITDLDIVKTATNNGDGTGTYTLTVTNNGPDDEPAAVVTDDLPAGVAYLSDDCGGAFVAPTFTWNIGALANLATVVCNIQVTILDEDDTVNTATVTGAGDPVGSESTIGIPPGSVLEIPTLGWQGLLILLLALGLAAVYMLRRRPART